MFKALDLKLFLSKEYEKNDCIVNGDAIQGLKHLKDNSVDLIIIDPPYKMTKRGKSCRPNYMKNNMGESLFDYPLLNTEEWISESFRVMKDGHFYVFTNTVSLHEILDTSLKVGFKLHNVISMIKDTGMPNRWYYKQTELVLFFRKGKAKPINDYTSRDNFHVVMPKKKNGKIHITQKPYDFVEKLVLNSSNENDLVLDFFSGSGTTLLACKNNNRRFLGFEIDKENYKNSILFLKKSKNC